MSSSDVGDQQGGKRKRNLRSDNYFLLYDFVISKSISANISLSRTTKELSSLEFKNAGKAWTQDTCVASPGTKARRMSNDPDADIAKAIQISLQESKLCSISVGAKTPQQPSKLHSQDILLSAQRTVVKSLCSSRGDFEGLNEVESKGNKDGDDGKHEPTHVPHGNNSIAIASAPVACPKNSIRTAKEVISDSEEDHSSPEAQAEGCDDDYGPLNFVPPGDSFL
jgi:hypothetical protein